MTDQIITITGLEFTTEGRPIAHGAIIREGAGTLEETMKAGGAQMGTLHPMDGCPMGRVEAKFAGQAAYSDPAYFRFTGGLGRTGGRSSVLRGTISAGGRG